MRTTIPGLGTAAALLVLAAHANAAPVTFDFTGVVNAVYDEQGIDPVVATGTTFSGAFTLEVAAVPFNVGADFTSYVENVLDFEVRYGTLTYSRAALPQSPFTSFSGGTQIVDNRTFDGRDALYVGSALATLPTDPVGLYRNVNLQGVSSNPDTFVDRSIPASLALAAFDFVPLTLSVTYEYWGAEGGVPAFRGYGYVSGFLSTLQVRASQVPEPGALALLAAGLLVMRAASHRRRPAV